jgi:hypothetical protein
MTEAQEAVDSLDDQGRWLEKGWLRSYEPSGPDMRVLNIDTYVHNLHALTEFLLTMPLDP